MKFKHLLCVAAAAAAVMLPGCDKNRPAKLSDYKDVTTADSLSFYFGEMMSKEYWQAAESDSLLAGADAKKAYMDGIQAGLKAVKDNNDPYNQGILVGIQMAMNMQEFQKTYSDVQINQKIMLDALRGGLTSDSAVNLPEAQSNFYAVLSNIEAKRAAADKKASDAALLAEAKKLNLRKISPTLYGKTLAAGQGEALAEGDMVNVEISATTGNGQLIDMPLPGVVRVGQQVAGGMSITQALTSMSVGETAQFAATPMDFAPIMYRRGVLKAPAPVVFTIKVTGMANAADNPAALPGTQPNDNAIPVVPVQPAPKAQR